MKSTKDQHLAGVPAKRRGQQMGTAGAKDQNRQEMAETPALRGRRPVANKMFADKSSQHIGSDPSKPRSNQPSVPAVIPRGAKGESGGETGFKRRLARKRSRR